MPEKFFYTCPDCGGLFLVERDEDYVKNKIGAGHTAQNYFDNLRFGEARKIYPNDSGVWLFRDFILPGFPERAIISLKEGQTDLFEIPDWLKKETGMQNLYIKMEGQSPSESFKDRGIPVAISDALRLQQDYPALGIKGISCASTGDTSAAAAVYSAYVRDKLRCLVLVPYQKISDPQLFQAMAHGAEVKAINHPKGFDGCMQLIQKFTARHPELVLVNSKNDMRVVGQETIALEILQDLGWQAPDWIAIPVGNAGNIAALLNSLLRAKEFGIIDKLPGIVGAQTLSADTLVRWAESGFIKYEPGEYKDTVASAMNINDPVSFPRVKKLYAQFNIKFYSSDEKEILKTWARFTRAGANICPQSAVALNAVLKAREGVIKEKDLVVSISTASAIKFAEAGIRHHKTGRPEDFANSYEIVDGNLEALEKSLAD
ncbi:MAG: Threonine synthase [Parcubacteria group bacterium GW2011_GWC1_45_13]|nr:MAG: Threonine synthase [Parcubacteria group bacterium GW2011_GWC1_45_13]